MILLRERWLYFLMALAAVVVTAAYQRSDPYAVELGTARDERYLEGFYNPEKNNTAPFRWTGARADVRLPAMWPSQPVRLTVALSAPRPGGQGTIPITLGVNGRVLDTPAVGAAPKTLDFVLDASTLGANGDFNFSLQTPTFTPAGDTRTLGAAVSRIEVTPLGAAPFVPSLSSLTIFIAMVGLVYVWLRRLAVREMAAVAVACAMIALAGLGVWLARPLIAQFEAQALYTLFVAFVASECAMWLIRRGMGNYTGVLANAPTVSIARWAAALFLVAFGLRMILAHSAGDPGNFIAFKMMITQVAEHGLASIYELDPIVGAYPAVHHYDWVLIGFLYRTFISPDFDADSLRLNFLMKMPTVTLDMLITVILIGYAAKRRGARFALLAGAAYALNPGILYASAFNGQLGDPLYSLFILSAVVGLLVEQPIIFGAAAALALLTKPQSSAFLPFFAVAWLRIVPTFPNHEQGQAESASLTPGPQEPLGPGVLATLRRNLLTPSQVRAAGSGLVTTLLVLLPFLLAGTVDKMVHTVSTTVGHAVHLSANAYNLWWLVGWGDAWGIADTALLLGPISYRAAGLVLLFVVANGLIAWKLWRQHDARALTTLAGFAGLAFFMLPTEIHENYLFPTMALLPLFAVHDQRAWRVWAILSVTWFINLLFVDAGLMDALNAVWPASTPLIFPIQVLLSIINIGVLLIWGYWVTQLGKEGAAISGKSVTSVTLSPTPIK